MVCRIILRMSSEVQYNLKYNQHKNLSFEYSWKRSSIHWPRYMLTFLSPCKCNCNFYAPNNLCYSNFICNSWIIIYRNTTLIDNSPALYSVYLRHSLTSISTVPAVTNSSSFASNIDTSRASITCYRNDDASIAMIYCKINKILLFRFLTRLPSKQQLRWLQARKPYPVILL